jgi:uncharacterized repeat protein (TIGR04052 family)
MKALLPAALVAAGVASAAAADAPVTIAFVPEIAGKAFSCSETYAGLGALSADVQVLDFRFYVSEAALIAADGSLHPIALEQDGAWQSGPVALIDFEDGAGSCTNGTPQTDVTLRGTAPDRDYVGLAFEIGVPFDLNHGDTTLAPAPLDLTAMFWNWRGGYKFVKFEVSPVGAGGMSGAVAGDAGWFLHLGSTLCAAPEPTIAPTAACGNPNRVAVRFDAFDPATNVVVIDPAPVLAAVDLTTNVPDTSPGCMSSPDDLDCATVLPRLGLPFGDHPALPQELATVR